jgi:hypothetical protein
MTQAVRNCNDKEGEKEKEIREMPVTLSLRFAAIKHLQLAGV